MTSQHDKAKRWRVRFSVRTLVIVVTLVCCYAACWEPTKSRGLDDVFKEIHKNDSRFLSRFATDVFGPRPLAPLLVTARANDNLSVELYYFWFFGYVAKLPYEQTIEPDLGPPVSIGLDPEEVSQLVDSISTSSRPTPEHPAHFAGTENFLGQTVPLPAAALF